MVCKSCGTPTFGPLCTVCKGERVERRTGEDRREDDATGFNVVPKRYGAQGRETIDQLRDAAGDLLKEALYAGCSHADAAFAVYCALTARKYHSRLGLKGPPEEDLQKAVWYEAMWEHVVDGGPDPRRYREGFRPYTRPCCERDTDFDGNCDVHPSLEDP